MRPSTRRLHHRFQNAMMSTNVNSDDPRMVPREDGNGRRVRKTVGTQVTEYVYDAEGQIQVARFSR